MRSVGPDPEDVDRAGEEVALQRGLVLTPGRAPRGAGGDRPVGAVPGSQLVEVVRAAAARTGVALQLHHLTDISVVAGPG